MDRRARAREITWFLYVVGVFILAGAVLVDQGLSGFLYTLAAGALLAAFLLALHNLVWGDDKD